MIPGHVLTLIGRLMLLINYDYPHLLKGRKQCRPGTNHYIHKALLGPHAVVIALTLRQRRIHDTHPVAKIFHEPEPGLIGQSNLRNEYNTLSARCNDPFYQRKVYFCLTAPRNPVDQIGFADSIPVIRKHPVYDFTLFSA